MDDDGRTREELISELRQLRREIMELRDSKTPSRENNQVSLESSARYQALFDHNPIESVIVDKEARVVEFNRAKKFSGGRVPAIGDVMYRDYAARHEIPMYQELLACINDGVFKEFPEQRYHDHYLHIRMAPFPGGAIITSIDITERKRMEEDLRHAHKLESLGVLAGGIAHDFNNLLTGVLGNISLSKIYTKPGDKIYETLTAAEEAAIQTKNLTRQLLTFSKGGEPVKKVASVAELVEKAGNFALLGSNVKGDYVLPDNLLPVEVDLGQVTQIFQNIIINAAQAMPKGGIIKVRAENITIGENGPKSLLKGNYVKISFADQGEGIAEELLGRIFDPYFSTREKGSGLGLAIAYSVVRNHGGIIIADSKLGAGTVITVYLPVYEQEAAPLAKSAEEENICSAKVLVMDDEDFVRDVAAGMLNHFGCEAEVAADGAEAIKLYEEARKAGHPFDAVIMDLTIPGGMGGQEALEKLLAIDPGVKAIVSSGYSNDPIMANFRKYGFKGVVSKPYRVETMKQALQEVISISS